MGSRWRRTSPIGGDSIDRSTASDSRQRKETDEGAQGLHEAEPYTAARQSFVRILNTPGTTGITSKLSADCANGFK